MWFKWYCNIVEIEMDYKKSQRVVVTIRHPEELMLINVYEGLLVYDCLKTWINFYQQHVANTCFNLLCSVEEEGQAWVFCVKAFNMLSLLLLFDSVSLSMLAAV